MPRSLVLCFAALVIVIGAASAHADAVTVVSFSWSVDGATVANASAACVASPLPPQCEVLTACSNNPSDSFAVGGTTLESRPTETYAARRTCAAVCNCCVGGASGEGGSQAQVFMAVSSSESTASWFLGALLSSTASAVSPDAQDCVEGGGDGLASTEQSWSLVFDVDGGNLTFSPSHVLAISGTGSSIESEITLSGDTYTVFTQSLSRSEEGATDGSTSITTPLLPGRFTLTIQSQLTTTASAPPNGSGGYAQADARVNFQLTQSPGSTSVGAQQAHSIPAVFLEANVPEPFSAGTSLQFRLRESAPVRLTIFDVAGSRVATLVNEVRSAGAHTVTWNGRGLSGERVSSGVYFASLVSGGETRTRRLTLSR
ncbi:MAG: FlgD immunoglobulin-like domain containing protein [bacterium]